MNNNVHLAEAIHCTGCAACLDVCPQACISMQYRDSLHATPIIDASTCISCGICMRTCPSMSDYKPVAKEQFYYMAWHKNDAERMSSTSGGAGAALVSWALNNGWYVSGAVLDESFVLSHIVTNDRSKARLLKGSKYIQSDMQGIYKRIRQLLRDGECVLFIGTPCQVEGLKKALPENMLQNVLTCGIICHGVNSPRVWEDYKTWLENHYKSKLEEYHFRSKTHGWQNSRGSANLRINYRFQNGKTVDEPAWRNLFHWWFGHHYMLRPSCLNCSYRKEYRNSDITIGDFWNVERIDTCVDTYKGVSAIITSSEKGRAFVDGCDELYLHKVDPQQSKQVLKGYIEKRSFEARQKEIILERSFETEYIENSFDYMSKKYPAQTPIKHFIVSVKSKLGL